VEGGSHGINEYSYMTDKSRNSRPIIYLLLGNGKHVYAVTNNHRTTDELLEAMFSMRCVPRLYKNNQLDVDKLSLVEAASNTSTVSLQFVRGDEKGTRCLGGVLGNSVRGEYKCGNPGLQVGRVSSLRQ
jgi:hypothetical protein